jgi:hypothetical protein
VHVRSFPRLLPMIAIVAPAMLPLSTPIHAQQLAGPVASHLTAGVRLAEIGDTIPKRPRAKAIEYSDWYERRATIHRIASWATLPLFAAEVVTGQELIKNGPEAAGWARDSHGIVAGSLGGLFALNTLTGAWNLWDSRADENGRKWRTTHAILMLVADAGFAYTGSLADGSENSSATRNRHRTAALTSSSVALVSYLMMLPPFRRD